MEKFNEKKIAILGFGIEGQSVCDFLKDVNASLTVFDEQGKELFGAEVLEKYESQGVEFRFGPIEDLQGFDMVFRSPGFHPDLPVLHQAREKGIEITSATKVFFDLCPCQIIGVTGTKGKGTTSTLIYEMLKEAGFDAHLGGNIGIPPLSFVQTLTKDSKVVLELSSFQLQDLEKSPHVAVMLMTTSEHLDYHSDIYEYIEAKRNIVRFQSPSDFAVLNKDYLASRESDIYTDASVYMVSREQDVDQGCYVKDEKILLRMNGREEEVLDTKELKLKGKHNWENACAAVVAALLTGASMKSVVPVLKSFKGLEHRIEYVATVRAASYYDDSFSTTPETAIAAIEAFDEPKILLLGGSSKGSDFTELGEVISNSSSIKAIIAIGSEWEKIRLKIKNERLKIIEDCESMDEVVQKASETTEIGDVVLLSPACASFDKFTSYKDRGEQFKKAVVNLAK